MMSNFKHKISLGTRAFCKAHDLDYKKSFYKNGTIKATGLKHIYEELKADIQMIQDKRDFESYDYLADFNKATVIVNQENIVISYSWENMKFDRYSEYEAVYDFMNHYSERLKAILTGYAELYGLICFI